MPYIELAEPIKIVGIKISTTNKDGRAQKDIKALWQEVSQQNLLSQVAHKSSDEIYALYTDYDKEGSMNDLSYSYIIGCPVSWLGEIPEGFISHEIPSGTYQLFEIPKGHSEKISEAWKRIWEHNFEKKRSFVLDFERYEHNGAISICIGVK